MPATATRETIGHVSSALSAGDDRYVLLREVLVPFRAHLPGRPGEFFRLSNACPSADSCWVVGTRDIDHFGFNRFAGCSSYEEIRAGFPRYRKAHPRSNIVPSPPETIFAEVKVLLADSGKLLHAALTRQPVYPQRARILLPLPGQSRIWAFIAAGVLNSAWGHAFYDLFFEQHPKARRNNDSVNLKALLDMPLAARGQNRSILEQVAELTHQLTVLGEARLDCRREWTDETVSVRQRLAWAIREALGVTEDEERKLLARVHQLNLPDAPPPNTLLHRPIPQKLVLQLVTENASPEERRRQLLWQIQANQGPRQALGEEWLWSPNRISRISLSAEDSKRQPRAYNGGKGDRSLPHPELTIIRDPLRCGGCPTVGPTRIRVHDIVSCFQQYDRDVDRLLVEYPNWTREQVEASLEYYRENKEEIDEILRAKRARRAARLATAS
jgi:uncharacterized protein (DUF433 family)